MRLRISVFIASALLVLTAGAAFAQLSQENRDFATGPASYFFTDDEKAQWKNVKTDADAKQFIDLFWARRDPTPTTPANEFRDEFNARVEYSDRQFGEGKRRGAMTDRGRILILLGAPTKVQRANASPTNTIQTPNSTSTRDQTQDYSGKQVWIYEQPKTRIQLGVPSAEIAFVDQYQTNQWTLERGGRADIAGISKRAVQAYVTQPNLTQVPTYSAAASTPSAPMNMPAATTTTSQLPTSQPSATAGSVGAFKTESLRTAVTDFQSAKNSPLNKNIAVTYTELLSPTGDYYVPVQLYIPKSAGMTAESVTTFFGVVQDAAGNNVAVFEEPATLSASKGDLYFDRTITLQPGKYKATLGLAGADGKPVVMSSSTMDLTPMSKDTTGISRLVLANDVHETEQPATIAAPYAFGRVKIVPKGDHVFSNRDEINYFLEVVNPGLDEGTNTPHLQVKLDLVQNVPSGKQGRTISAPITDASALPLSGAVGPGQYAILAGIPLGQMKNPPPPGDYTLRVKVYDQVKKENWTAEQKLTLVEGPAAPSTTTTSGTK